METGQFTMGKGAGKVRNLDSGKGAGKVRNLDSGKGAGKVRNLDAAKVRRKGAGKVRNLDSGKGATSIATQPLVTTLKATMIAASRVAQASYCPSCKPACRLAC